MKNIEKGVRRILSSVRENGDSALLFWTKKLDGVNLSRASLRLKADEIQKGARLCPQTSRRALVAARKNILRFQRALLSEGRIRKACGFSVRLQPIDSVGLYIPGGQYPYPSTLLMTAVPARAAGVGRIAMVTPPKNITPEILFAARLCGISEIYRVGGPQAIAALAYGTKSIPKVDKVAGPGNAYVTCAKRLVFGDVGVDLLAGPSEVAIFCDGSAPEEWVREDLLAQAEHRPDSCATLFSLDADFLKRMASGIPQRMRSQIRLVKVSGEAEALKKINALAPEHLQIMSRHSKRISRKIKNAGAIFEGRYSPAVMGDYVAGPSHVLPTGGSAKFSSGLSLFDFMKRAVVMRYSESRFRREAPVALRLARAEGLKRHARSLEVRGIK